MTAKIRRTMLILPLCLLYLNVLEEVVVYKTQGWVADPYLRAGVLVAVFAIGFTLVGNLLAPWLASLFEAGHKASKRQAGSGGLMVFHCVMLAVIYAIYFVVYVRGAQYLLPPSWR